MQKKQMIDIANSFIIAWNDGNSADIATITLSSVEGMLESPKVITYKAPNRFKDGAFISTFSTLANKKIAITLVAAYPDGINIRGLRTNLAQMAANPNTLFPITLTTYIDDNVFNTMTVNAYIDDNFFTWTQFGNSVTTVLRFVTLT